MSLRITILRAIILNLHLIVAALFVGVGVFLIPLLSRIFPAGLPAFIGEPLANKVWKVALATQGVVICKQLETDEYTLECPENSKEYAPKNFWSRLAGVPFGLTYVRSKEAFGGSAERLDPGAMVADGGDTLGENKAKMGSSRGGRKTFIDTQHDEGLFVRFGELVSQLKDTDGLDSVNVARDQTEKTEGGKNGMGSLAKAIYWSVMGVMGATMGLVMFFL